MGFVTFSDFFITLNVLLMYRPIDAYLCRLPNKDNTGTIPSLYSGLNR